MTIFLSMKIELNSEEYKLILEALLELPAKRSLGLILNLENQVKATAPVMARASKEKK